MQVVFGGCQNTTWFPLLLPYLEQQSVALSFNFNLGPEGMFPSGQIANSTVMMTWIGSVLCPSDRRQAFKSPSGALWGAALSRGNYAVNWGNGIWLQVDMGFKPPLLQLRSPFGHEGNIGLEAVTDGLSMTIFMSEVLQGSGADGRGLLWSPMAGSSLYMTRFTPNGFHDFAGSTEDVLLNPFCNSDPGQKIPCLGDDALLRTFAGSRSRHPGGVNTLLGDGSVRFVRDSINHPIWIGLHSISGGEVIGADAF